MPDNTTVIYQIRIQGQIDESWSDWLGGLTITPQPEGETLLAGPIVDQAALHGIMDRLYAINLSILSVAQVRNEQDLDPPFDPVERWDK
jgi:hypothetical protein